MPDEIKAHFENTNLNDAYLANLESLSAKASPGPWFPRAGDDEHCMNARWVSLDEGPGLKHDGFIEDHPSGRCVAITLLQQPRLADLDNCHDSNMLFICAARAAIPLLVAEVKKLREELANVKTKVSPP